MEIINLNKIPKEQRTYSLCLEAVSQNKINIKYVPIHYKSKELCEHIKYFNGILKYTPYKLKTYKICINAVKRNRFDLQYVPRKYKTVELCLTSLFIGTESFRYIPKYLLTEEFYKLAISINPYILRYIPENSLNIHLCFHAVLQDHRIIDYIPKEYRSKCSKLIERNCSIYKSKEGISNSLLLLSSESNLL
jgi:hypothetical protein